MDSNLIASFKIRTSFYNVISWQHLILYVITVPVVSISSYSLFSYLIIDEAFLLTTFFTVLSIAYTANLLRKLDVRSFDHSTLLFYTDKLIIKEHYEIKEHKSAVKNFIIEQMVQFANPVDRITEYSYKDITLFDIFYNVTEQNQKYVFVRNNFLLNLEIGYQKEKIRLFVPDVSVVMQMQRVLKHLYELHLNISEGTSENKKTYLLYYKDDSNKKMLDLIDEIGKDKQAE